MKKVMLMMLALVMTMCLASYGSAGSNVSTSSVPETPAVVTEVANTTTETSETSDMTNPAYWSKEVDIHCTPELIEKFGYDTLAPLVQRIKDQIVPRAIGALTEAYPAFNDEGAVGTEISLFIYGADEDVNKSEIYQGLVQHQNAAYVLGGAGEGGYCYVLGVNAAPLLSEEGVVIEDDVQIGALTVIARGAIDNTVLKRGAKIDNSTFISHNVVVGEDTFVVGETIMFGSSSELLRLCGD